MGGQSPEHPHIVRNPTITRSRDTRLSAILKPNVRDVHLATCRVNAWEPDPPMIDLLPK